MAINRCSKCDEYIYEWKPPHICSPEYEVIEEDIFDGANTDWDEAYKIYDYDHEGAAAKCAEKINDDIGEGACDRVFYVRDKKTLTVKKFSMTHDYSVNYYAHDEEIEQCPTCGEYHEGEVPRECETGDAI